MQLIISKLKSVKNLYIVNYFNLLLVQTGPIINMSLTNLTSIINLKEIMIIQVHKFITINKHKELISLSIVINFYLKTTNHASLTIPLIMPPQTFPTHQLHHHHHYQCLNKQYLIVPIFSIPLTNHPNRGEDGSLLPFIDIYLSQE